MRTIFKFSALFLSLLIAQTGYTQNISGSKHDFSANGWGSTEICIFCHAPHNGTASYDAPLWNHGVTTATYTLYSSSTLDAGPMAQPSGNSKLCLSCHDGTVAVDSYGGATGTNFIPVAGLLGTDLSNDHPVGFSYNTSLSTSDGELHNPATVNSGLGSTIALDLLFGAGNDQLECASCHDVHNFANNGKFLRKANTASALCLTCHNK